MSVFISYSRADNEFVDLLQRLLISKGYSVWVDRNQISVGSRWDKAIQKAIDESSHLIVILSDEATNSENVADEWSYALEKNRIVVPLLYGCTETPLRLRRLQWIDFEKLPFAEAFKLLVSALGEPDNRPSDPIQLARREGFILVEVQYPLDIEKTRVAYIYSDYPLVQSFLNVVYATLLQGRVQPHKYDEDWVLRDKGTGQEYGRPADNKREQLLLHEVGIEPGTQLEIIFRKGLLDEFHESLKRS